MAWYIPAHTAPMFYLLREGHSENDSLNAVPWPTLVYVASKNSLHIAAVKVKSRPKPRSRLYHAPLMNIYDTTSVCTGSIELPSDTTVDSLPQWQKVIEQTFFTHTNHRRTLVSREKEVTDDELYGFWQSLEGVDQFPTRRLTPILCDDKQPLYLEDWINEHL
jgi:PRTRC genetic system protein B